MSSQETLRPLLVTRKEAIARDTHLFELRNAVGPGPLPAFSAGAHVSVYVQDGVVRQYSLCNDPQETHRYQIAVKSEQHGRGGSKALVERVSTGDTVMVGTPANFFKLTDRAESFILIAGGIGITPMMAMIRSLHRENLRKFRLYYLTRDPKGTAFLDELSEAKFADNAVIHHDYGDPLKAFDLSGVLKNPTMGTHIYCCGPKSLMDGVQAMTEHWPAGTVHFENFSADTKFKAEDQAFEVLLQRSGLRLKVPADVSILETLREHDIDVSTSCENGTCGSCIVKLLEGDADHRDQVLLDNEKTENIVICVSRAKSDCLVLDL